MESKIFMFHIHLPEGIKKIGKPIVLGNRKELGNWENPIVKLCQPFFESPTYWQSEPINISLSNLSKKDVIRYKFAIHVPNKSEKFIFEGNDDKEDDRILDIDRNNQFAIWKNDVIYLNNIQDYAFVNYIFNSIESYNLKDKITEYQYLLSLHNELTIQVSNIEFIINHIDDKLREKRLFLCLLLGYHISRQDSNYELPKFFLSELLLDALDDYNQENFSDVKVQMRIAIATLIRHNAFQYQFNWLKIFKIAADVDPGYTFIDHLKTLNYHDDGLLATFIKEAKIISPYIKNIEFDIYINLAKWLIQLCHNNDSLFKLWDNILFHNNAIDEVVLKSLVNQIQKNISNDDAVTLENDFERIPKNYQGDVTGIFRSHSLFLLESPLARWTGPNITAIKKLIQNDSLNWNREDIIQSLELVSQSCNLELLNLFPEILDNWFSRDFSDTKEKKMPKHMHPLLSHRKNIWQNLTAVAVERVKGCSESQIIGAIKFIVRLKEQEVKELFLDLVKEILNKVIQQIDSLINKIFMICNCEGKALEVPNVMCEDILCYITTRLSVLDASEQYINIMEYRRLWFIILNATGNVEKLHANSYVQRIQTSIVELHKLFLEKKINMGLLQSLSKYSNKKIFQFFEETIGKNKTIYDVIISQDEIMELRKYFQLEFQTFIKFLNKFCSTPQVIDKNHYIQNMQNLEIKQLMESNYWKNMFDNVKSCYKYCQSQVFQNIFETCIQDDSSATKVEYIVQKLVPIAIEKYNTIHKQFEEWEKLKCSDVLIIWKTVKNIDAELDLIEAYENKDQKLVQALNNLLLIPHYFERLANLENVVKIFEVPHNNDDWLSTSIRNLKNDSMKLGQINDFFDYLYSNLSDVNQDCWKFIKELSDADEFIGFLKKLFEHDIRNLINCEYYSDEKLIREDTISSLIQIKQYLIPLMKNIEDIFHLLKEILIVVKNSRILVEKIALCKSSHTALQNMYNNIQNPGKVTREKIKNAVLNGTYTFVYDVTVDKCLFSLECPKFNEKYNLGKILDLHERALFIANQKIMNDDDAEMFKDAINQFIIQVNIAQEIVNIASMIMQMGHFGYRIFEKKLQGTDSLKDYLRFLKEELKKWQSMIDQAHKRCYYLTFFTARHILSLYDYFASEILDIENEEECKTLISFVNGKAQLSPSHRDTQIILRESKDYFVILCKIGNELERIFRNIPKQSRKFDTVEQRVVQDVVIKDRLFIATYNDKSRVPNIIMSLYANHGYYPESWQLLICTSLTNIEELSIFIKRCFFASNNGYENQLFCIANLELLNFDSQRSLVNQIRLMQSQKKGYLLALIYYKDETVMYHYILDQFSLSVHATNGLNDKTMSGIYKKLCQNVIRVSSDLSGQGKTRWIKENSSIKKRISRNFLISDSMEFRILVQRFKKFKLQPVESLHINVISADYPDDVNMFLFELLTLGVVFTNSDIACLPSSETPIHIFIEIASTTELDLLDSITMAGYLLFNHLTWNIKNMIVSQEIHSPIQITCYYLNLLDRNVIDSNEIFFKPKKETISTEKCQDLIAKYLFDDRVYICNIFSFRFVEIFVNFLANQLTQLSSSKLFTVSNMGSIAEDTNIRTLILRNLIYVSKDFAAISFKPKEEIALITYDANGNLILQCDDSNPILFFNSNTSNTISALYRDRTKVHDDVKNLLKSQVIRYQTNWELDDYNSMSHSALFTKLVAFAQSSKEKPNLPEYALTCDNLMKMALILLRVRANIPVIVCGKAGCGKTSLIVYLAMVAGAQFQILNLHAGINEQIITNFLNDALEKAEESKVWLLFDEINTCNHLGLLADLISSRVYKGNSIHQNIRLFATCNPYRFHKRIQSGNCLANKVKRFEERGKVKRFEERSKVKRFEERSKVKRFGERSNLIYQVKLLPSQILDYVWNYDNLYPQDELKYIEVMVKNELKDLGRPVLIELLFASQEFIRQVVGPYNVSLRDVKRAITLVKFFYDSCENRSTYKKTFYNVFRSSKSFKPTTTTRSYVLALSLCYNFQLNDQNLRKQYRRKMEQILQNHETYVGEYIFDSIIREEQEYYINKMQCPPNTAHNEALLENVFVMIVCIMTRIPLFLIGAPGSSKSYAIRLINSNLRGPDSIDEYFRKLPQVYLIPYQGSSLSTSDDILKIFDKANRYQEMTSKQFPVISVVLLDKVELAETSPSNPLKVLHSLLEPNYPSTGPTVSVIGISNWRLDNSKSSRALLVQRPQFGLDDLVHTAKCLLNTRVIEYEQRGVLEPLAKTYLDYKKHEQDLPNFHGLRDYYALVKRLSLDEMTSENIQLALARNFGGTENNALYERYFGNVFETLNNNKSWSYNTIPIVKLIDSNLDDPDARHLMFIGKSNSIVNLLTYRMRNLDPVVILGSQFPDDRDDYNYSILRKIMICIETGRPLIISDLETIYGYLYDLWDQNYIVAGSKENVKYFTKIALGVFANPLLSVSPNFKCILVIDENKLVAADPSLLNRFEKQKISIVDILNEKQKNLMQRLDEWAKQMSTLIEVNQVTLLRNKFTQMDLFIGFDKDETLQSLVFDITMNNPEVDDDEILERCKECLIAITTSDGIIRAERSNLERDEINRWKYVYFHQQHHDSLYDYISALFNQEKSLKEPNGNLIIVNTFSNININVKSCLQGFIKCQVYRLSTFRTEAQFSNLMKHFWLESTDHMLILQYDITDTSMIKLTKYIIEQFRNEFITKQIKMAQSIPMKNYVKTLCIIFHINQEHQRSTSSPFNFMCGWKQITIESLDQKIQVHNFFDRSLYDIINSEIFKKLMNSTMPFEKLFKDELLWCFSCIKYQHINESYNRNLYKEILGNTDFIQCIKTKAFNWIFTSCKDWQFEVACNKDYLNQFKSFSLALENYVKITIKQTIAKIFYSLEKLSATATFFTIKNNDEYEIKSKLCNLWKKMLMDDTIININNLPEAEPSKYVMPCATVNELEFPFSYYFMNQINYYEGHYDEDLYILSQDPENISNVTKRLHEELIENHIEDFKNNLHNIFSVNPIYEDLEKYSELYYKDFIKIILSSYSTTKNLKNEEALDFILKNLIGDKIVEDPFLLHLYWWKYGNNILTQLQLIENFPSIITKVQEEFIVHGTLDQYLFKESINLILQNLCDDDDEWEQKMSTILSLSNKINTTQNSSILSLLLICSDLLKINSIPLEKIKEMINLGKTAKKQEFIGVDIIEFVFGGLDYDNNLTHIRSFIMRILDLVPIESEIRLTICKNIFMQKPFQLINVIIEKIFITEKQHNEQIFLILIKNPEVALQLSNRLMFINKNLNINDSESSIVELCCEIIQTIFNEFDLKELFSYFKCSIETFKKQEDFPLQKIASIALLKEFVFKFWYNYLYEDNTLSRSLINEINNCFEIDHLFIQSLKSYFLLGLRLRLDQLQKLEEDFPWTKNECNINFLPKLWTPIKRVNFKDFITFYNSNYNQNSDNYPFISIYISNYEKLNLVKHLYPIVKFVKIVNSKLEYILTRRSAQTMTFREYIEKESMDDIVNGNYLKTLFEGFALGWNSVINCINQNQLEKLYMDLERPVIFSLIERKDKGIYLCKILEWLIKSHNEFLDNFLAAPIGKCKNLKFLEDSPYYIKSVKLFQLQDINFINEDSKMILNYSQRKEMANFIFELVYSQRGEMQNFIFDLQQIEKVLVKELVYDKVYIEKEDNGFYLKEFPFKHEIFHNSKKIIFNIRNILPQEPIPIDKVLLILTIIQPSSSLILENSLNSVNLNELLFLFEKILCLIEELSIKNNNILIIDFINQWLKLARYSITFIDILKEFSLKYVVALYELIEEQVVNSTIHNIDDKFKVPLTQQMKDSINNFVNQQDVSFKAFALALKRFINRFLLIDSNIENLDLSIYFLDFTLELWTSDVPKETIKRSFPTDLLVSHAYNCYTFVVEEIEKTKKENVPTTSPTTGTRKKLKNLKRVDF
ncbi:hypothetical protein RclHR1_07030002 [Rhizophagus clarus]|uniref:AAA+ ATPase domain-containing protein n=1 Tax=Rhizophagus clarus TaxID=94130 RepID=A0A2Z6SBU6_9GLOM|nr:hypothetical protein RclHR1_07030002 [Rhizophagus clarus]